MFCGIGGFGFLVSVGSGVDLFCLGFGLGFEMSPISACMLHNMFQLEARFKALPLERLK